MEGGSIAVVMEDIQTRTAVTDEGAFTWSAGDQIWLEITANPGYVTGTLSSGAGTGSANFAYGTYFGDMTGKAVYPFNAGHNVNGTELSVVLPASYDLGSNLSNTNAAMYGVKTNGSIKFNHLAGVMRFKFINAPVGTDKFIITLDKKINGTFAADLTGDYPVLQTETTSNESEKSITLNFDALTSVQDIMLYVPLPLGTYTTLGLEVKAGSQSVWSYSNTVTNTINRKSLILMPSVTLAGSVSGDIEGGDTPGGSQDGDYIDEYGINHGQGVEIDGVVWAPVNCGYHATDYKYGKLYQWGRKYGQGYDSNDASVPSIVEGGVISSTGQSASNADKFYLGSSSSYYDWLSYLDRDNFLWNSGTEDAPVKTEYDPCPEGWRVPTYAELNSLSTNKSSWSTNDNHNGYWFSGSQSYSSSVTSVFFSAAGRRYGIDGGKDLRTYCGHYWSSRPNSTNAQFLSFGSGSVGMNELSRSNGYSVRCVREDSMLEVPDEPSRPDAVDLSAAGTANSYIVSSAGSYKFSTVKGNSSESVGAVVSAEVLWETFGTSETPSVGFLVSNVRYEGGDIFFNTPETFKEGNAVIAAKDASGTILWSWHIWLTDQPEEQVYYNNAGTMMDRNLGATSATPGDVGALGLLYQWGRKDPFLGSSSISSSTEAKSTLTWPSAVSSDSSNGTIDYALEHPTTFITYNSNNYDWYYTGSSSTDNTRWQSSKTIYDPCPAGWRVPDGGDNGVWSIALGSSSYFEDDSLYDSTNEGMNFSGRFGSSSIIWYPASGSRFYSDGRLSNIGSISDYWSASVSSYSYYAYLMGFHVTGTVFPSYGSDYRASGQAVRCIREDSAFDEPEEPSAPDSSQPSYSLQLNPSTYGWVQSTSVPNPDASLYDGVYESTNGGVHSSCSVMYIDISGYDNFKLYVRSYAESNYDFVVVSYLDYPLTQNTYVNAKVSTKGKQDSSTSIGHYTLVEFKGIGGGNHRITVMYLKDSSGNSNDDKGYVLIPKNQGNQTPSEQQKVDYVDEYGINHGQGVEIDGVVWAPVNCGYHATDYQYGKLYQWGRKYGQGYDGDFYDLNGNESGTYSDVSVPSIVSGPVSESEGQSSSNSNKFYDSSSSPYDWVTPQDDTLWNSGTDDNPIKTEYDPCPAGWRVPTYAELNNLKSKYWSMTTSDGQKGCKFNDILFLPAAGYRYYIAGNAYARGRAGRYWSSEPYDPGARYLDFSNNGVGVIMAGTYREHGFSVRCVQE